MTPDRDGDGTTVHEVVDELESPEEELEEAFDEELAHAAELEAAEATGEKRPNALLRLYRGGTSFDFIGNRRWWFGVSALIIVLGIFSLGVRGLNEGIDFKGGQSWLVSSQTLTVPQATSAVEAAGLSQPTVVQLTDQLNGQKQIEVTADLNSKSVTERQAIETQVQDALARVAHVNNPNDVSYTEVGSTWGSQVTHKAIEALIVFFIAVTAYISLRFEFKMAVAAIVAVFHDVLIVLGIYSIFGFLVTPDTVIAVLTVLGYSLYDTVVVFDRIRDNSQGLGASGRITYSDMVNLSMNQTLARSINTSLVAIIPVFSVLVIGSVLLGAETLQSFGLALVIGLTSGAYSSIFIASPLLALMKERESRYVTIRQRLEARGERGPALTPAAAAAMAGAAGGSGSGRGSSKVRTSSGVIRPGQGKSSKRAGGPAAATAVAATTAGGAKQAGSAGAARAGGSRPPAPGSTRPAGNRPPPRPRKGKGKGKGKRR